MGRGGRQWRLSVLMLTEGRRSELHQPGPDSPESAQNLPILTIVEFSNTASEQTPWRYELRKGGKVQLDELLWHP